MDGAATNLHREEKISAGEDHVEVREVPSVIETNVNRISERREQGKVCTSSGTKKKGGAYPAKAWKRSFPERLAALERSDSTHSPVTGSEAEGSEDAGYFGTTNTDQGYFDSNPAPESVDELRDNGRAQVESGYEVSLHPFDPEDVVLHPLSSMLETPGSDNNLPKTPTVRFASNAQFVSHLDLDASIGGSTLAAASAAVAPQPITIPMRSDELSEPGHITVVYPDESSPRDILAYDEDELQLGWSNELLVSPLADQSGGARQIGLESEEAARRLVEHCRDVLGQYAKDVPIKVPALRFFQLPNTLSSLFALLLLLLFLVGSLLSGSISQSRHFAVPVELALVIFAIVVNAWLYVREERLVLREMPQRAEKLLEKLSEAGMNMIQEVRIPTVPSVSSSRVVRDGVIRTFPHTLLVAGDIVELAYGDKAPCRCHYVYASDLSASMGARRSIFELRRGELFRPLLFEGKGVEPCEIPENGREAPPLHVLPPESTLATGGRTRPAGELASSGDTPQFEQENSDNAPQFEQENSDNVPWPSVANNTTRTAQYSMADELRLNNGRFQFVLLETPARQTLHDAFSHNRPDSIIENQLRIMNDFFVGRILPSVFAGAVVMALVRYLARDRETRSTQGWEELIAIPVYTALPLVPLSVPAILLIARALGNAQVLSLFDALQQSREEYEDVDDVDEFDVAPPPTKDVDVDPSETTWFRPFPQVEELLVIDSTDNPVILDVSEQPSALHGVLFEDSDWQSYIPCLRPLSRAMGFVPEAVKNYQRYREIYTFAPHHHSIRDGLVYGYAYEVPSMYSQILHCDGDVEDPNSEWLVMSDGTLDLVLESCADYWGGDHLGMLDETVSACVTTGSTARGRIIRLISGPPQIERKVLDYYHTAIENDMQVIAFSYRPIQYGTELPILHMHNEQLPVYLELPGCGYPRRDSKGSNEHHRRNSKTSLADPSSASEADDAALLAFHIGMLESKVAHNESRVNGLPPPLELFEDSSDKSTIGVPWQDMNNAGSSNRSANLAGPPMTAPPIKNRSLPKKKRKPRKRVVSAVDLRHSFESKDEKVFFQEVVKGQTFLGVAVLSTHHPKPNVSDFIEDLKLAGIRFVFFSPAPEPYAERLGLETDWNTCILLSDDSEGGYRELHDIKARLPRGIVNIRHHLQEVDDIPLHVSLFAECSPESTEEMIRIFQEYGEVVCCIGSALNSSNTAAFATVCRLY
ncbi:hypothetical protein HDU93_002198 [Gonapodya sp. JEL0774]|nr:hypothetical protein HDU93_002198 [Gonapodya sp. JEL0774]